MGLVLPAQLQGQSPHCLDAMLAWCCCATAAVIAQTDGPFARLPGLNGWLPALERCLTAWDAMLGVLLAANCRQLQHALLEASNLAGVSLQYLGSSHIVHQGPLSNRNISHQAFASMVDLAQVRLLLDLIHLGQLGNIISIILCTACVMISWT